MTYVKSSMALALVLCFGLASLTFAAEGAGQGGQGGMQPGTSKGSLGNPESSDPGSMTKKKSGETSQQKKSGDTESIPPTTGKQGDANVSGSQFGESGSGQGSGGGSGTQSGSGVGSR